MKLKYILGILLSAFLFVGCSDDDEAVGTFDNIKIDKTYVSIPETGGDATITVTSTGDWQFDKIFMIITKNDGVNDTTYQATPDWLTASVTQGSAGETKVTFHADETSGGRETELQITANGHKQFVMLRQGSMEASTATVAEVLAAPDGKTFRVTGTVTKIANTTYGNWYLADETGEVYIYGTLDKNGSAGKNNSIDVWGIEVGDVVTVEGPKTTYKETVELVNVTVIDIVKSLVKVESEPATVSKAGGEVEVKVSYKGAGAYFSIPEADRSWISFVDSKYIAGDADTVVFKFAVQPNEGASRKSDLTFTSANSETESSVVYTISQESGVTNPATGKGTKASPFNVTAALEYTKALGADVTSEEDIYVTGIISSIKYTYSAQYGTATYNISADGKEENVFTVYGSYFFNNEPWQEGQAQIAVGDKVVVCGKVIYYKGTTPEFASKNNYLVSLNGNSGTTDGGGTEAELGTVDNPYDVDGILAVASQLEEGATSDAEYYFKGKISSIKYTFSANYGTAQFNISNDGSTEGTQFLIYGTYYLGNRAWTEGDTQIAVGDEVVICGKLTNYKGTLETANKNNYIYSLNGKTE